MSLSYIAGILDGEGSIHTVRRKYVNKVGDEQTYYYISTTISMKGKAGQKVMERIHEEMNGIGEVYEHKKMFTYHCHGEDAKVFLDMIRPFVFSKKEQLEAR